MIMIELKLESHNPKVSSSSSSSEFTASIFFCCCLLQIKLSIFFHCFCFYVFTIGLTTRIQFIIIKKERKKQTNKRIIIIIIIIIGPLLFIIIEWIKNKPAHFFHIMMLITECRCDCSALKVKYSSKQTRKWTPPTKTFFFLKQLNY